MATFREFLQKLPSKDTIRLVSDNDLIQLHQLIKSEINTANNVVPRKIHDWNSVVSQEITYRQEILKAQLDELNKSKEKEEKELESEEEQDDEDVDNDSEEDTKD